MKNLLLDSFNLAEMSSAVVSRHIRRARWVMGILLVLLVGYLIFGPKPFEPGMRQEVRQIIAETPAGELPDLKLEHYIISTTYTVVIINTILAAALLATAGVWARPIPTAYTESDMGLVVDARAWWDAEWWFWAALLLSMILAFALRAPLANKSLWWDEAWGVKRVMVGFEQPRDDAPRELKHKDVGWDRTFFYYEKPTNHVGFSVPARFSNSIWRTLTGAEDSEFNEFFIRLPSLLAGLVSLVLMGLLMRDLGYPGLGIAGAFLLAIHPWHLRYTVEGRGFGIVMMCALLITLMVIRALRYGNWRYWILCAAGHLLLLWSFPYGIFLSILLGLFTLLGILIYQGGVIGGGTFLGRFFVTHLVAGMVFLQLVAPWLPQMKRWGGQMEEASHNWVTGELLLNFWTFLTTGMAWNRQGLDQTVPDLASIIGAYPFPLAIACYALLWVVFPLLVIVGFVRLGIFSNKGDFMPQALVLAIPFTAFVAFLRQHYFYERYMIFALPGIIICLLLGIFMVGSWFRQENRRMGYIAVVAFFPVFLFFAAPQLALLLNRPLSPMRDTVRFIQARSGDRGVDQPLPPRAGFQLGGKIINIYDPYMAFVQHGDQLLALAAEARELEEDFYVFVSHEGFNRAMFANEEYGSPFRLLDDPEIFREIKVFHGIEPDQRHRIFQYTGAPLPDPPAAEPAPEATGENAADSAAADPPAMEGLEPGLRPADQPAQADPTTSPAPEPDLDPQSPPTPGQVPAQVPGSEIAPRVQTSPPTERTPRDRAPASTAPLPAPVSAPSTPESSPDQE